MCRMVEADVSVENGGLAGGSASGTEGRDGASDAGFLEAPSLIESVTTCPSDDIKTPGRERAELLEHSSLVFMSAVIRISFKWMPARSWGPIHG